MKFKKITAQSIIQNSFMKNNYFNKYKKVNPLTKTVRKANLINVIQK